MVQPSALPEAVELCDLLSRYELEGLFYAHDLITREQSDHTPSPMTPNHSPPPPTTTTITDTEDDQDSDIKVIKIKIEKTNEPLVSNRPSIKLQVKVEICLLFYAVCYMLYAAWLIVVINVHSSRINVLSQKHSSG